MHVWSRLNAFLKEAYTISVDPDVMSMVLKHHKTCKNIDQRLKAFFIHFMQFCVPCLRHKNDVLIELGQVLE